LRFTTVSRRSLGFFASTAFAAALEAAAAEKIPTPSIERKSLEGDIRFLASDELGGRGNGSAGLSDAALFIRKRFEVLGLEPVGDAGSFLQTFRVSTGQELGRHTSALLRTPEGARSLECGSDFEPLSVSASGEVEAPVVFAGYGVTAPEHEYDDYASVDVRGRIVLLLRYAPEPFGEQGWHATFVRKAQNAASHGALAVLVVNGPRQHREDRLVPFGVDVGAGATAPIPTVHLGREHAEVLLRASGRSLVHLQSAIDDALTPRSFTIDGAEMALTVDVRRATASVANVLGYLPATGSAAKGRREHIVIGAHYDHLGLGEKGGRDHRSRGLVHNGADDNASGVAGILELARVFSLEDHRPRGILFAAFAGEELGLKGSYYYTRHPALPLKDAVAMVNLDMIGRLRHDVLYLGGIERLPQLRGWVERRLAEEGLVLSARFTAEEDSDHAPFLHAGVPSLLFFTGLHGDYHKPTDDAQFINLEGMERVLRAGFRVSSELLRGGERPALVAADRGDDSFRKNAAYFGIGVDPTFDGEGLRFAYVAEGGPAARAGLEAGDVLLAIDGRPIGSGDRASTLIQERRPGEIVNAKIRRKGLILEVKVRLSSWP
jgi:hypothetical protein